MGIGRAFTLILVSLILGLALGIVGVVGVRWLLTYIDQRAMFYVNRYIHDNPEDDPPPKRHRYPIRIIS